MFSILQETVPALNFPPFFLMNAKHLRGIFFGAFSAACYGLNPLFAVPLLREGVGVDSVLFFRFAVAASCIGILIKIRGKSLAVSLREFVVLVIMATLMTASSLSLFYGYTMMPAGVASTLLFLYPIFVAIIMIVFFREKISLKIIGAIALAFVGVVLLCGADAENGASPGVAGVAVIALSALTYAIYLVAVNKTRLRGMNGTKLSFYILLIGAIILFANAMIRDGGLTIPADAISWLNIFLLATIPTLLSTVAIVFALRDVGPTVTAILGAFEPLAAVSAGVLALGEPFTPTLAAGMFLIIVAVALIVLARNSGEKSPKIRAENSSKNGSAL